MMRGGVFVVSMSAMVSAVVLSTAALLNGADLVLADKGKTDYQIVLPDEVPGAAVNQALAKSAGVLEEMFKANGCVAPVVRESQADTQKPGIYLGDTAAARAAGLEGSKLPVWTYAWKTAGRNVMICGRDWQTAGGQCSLGTVKGLTDFMRQYCGTRFLTPGGLAGIEFLPMATIAVPDGLNLRKEPMVNFNAGGGASTEPGSIALNFLANVTTEYFAHTHELAVPADKYLKTNPEYFAQLNGKPVPPHLCYSNKDVQELIYKDMLRSFDAGFPEYLSLQADGFRGCGCDKCKTMFGATDWGEKLWLLNKHWAERLLKDRPGKFLIVTAYTVTGDPPASFKEFPANMRVCVGGYPRAFETWAKCRIPAGFTSYLHAWGFYHLCGFLPVRTPLYAERVVKMFDTYTVKGVGLDGPPANMWGLEGPTIYVYAGMLDDVKNRNAAALVDEYIQAAYGKAAPAMSRFFDELHHTLEAYAEVFGVDNGSFQTYTRADGRSVRYLTGLTRQRLIGFLYSPETLALLESSLAQAEKVAGLNEKNQLRLALVRREFDFLKSTARVVHLYNAYLTRSDRTFLDPLLTEMEAREKMILGWCDTNRPYGGRVGVYTQRPISPGWPLYIGGPGVLNTHLIANGTGYLSESVPPFTWNIPEMRQAQLFEGRTMAARHAPAPLSPASEEWNRIPAEPLTPLSGGAVTAASDVKLAYDAKALYIRFSGALPEGWRRPAEMRRDDEQIVAGESFNVLLAPDNNPARYFRFAGGALNSARYEARHGFIEDSIDPRFNQDDVTWDCAWDYQCAVAPDGKSWNALLVIPFASLNAAAPAAGTEWRVNFARVHQAVGTSPQPVSLWSSPPNTKGLADRNAFGKLVFEADAAVGPVKNPLQAWREEYGGKTGGLPEEWLTVPNPLPTALGPWVFRADPADQGIKEEWFAVAANVADWLPVKVPGFWAETENIGDYQGAYAWYRTTFVVPEEWKGRSLRLLFGAIDEQAWIYVNGRPVREHTEKSEGKTINELWEESFSADVSPEALNYGGANVLAVRVHNSAGNGGIWRAVLGHAVKRK